MWTIIDLNSLLHNTTSKCPPPPPSIQHKTPQSGRLRRRMRTGRSSGRSPISSRTTLIWRSTRILASSDSFRHLGIQFKKKINLLTRLKLDFLFYQHNIYKRKFQEYTKKKNDRETLILPTHRFRISISMISDTEVICLSTWPQSTRTILCSSTRPPSIWHSKLTDQRKSRREATETEGRRMIWRTSALTTTRFWGGTTSKWRGRIMVVEILKTRRRTRRYWWRCQHTLKLER